MIKFSQNLEGGTEHRLIFNHVLNSSEFVSCLVRLDWLQQKQKYFPTFLRGT